MSDMVRINARISKEVNEWLDNKSETSGVPKSTLVYLALEQYIQQQQAMTGMLDMAKLVDKLELIERKLEGKDLTAK